MLCLFPPLMWLLSACVMAPKVFLRPQGSANILVNKEYKIFFLSKVYLSHELCWCAKGRHENPSFFWFLFALHPIPSVSPFPPFFPPPHLPVLTSASQPYPASFLLLSEVGRHGEEDVLAPALRCSSISHCTQIVWILPLMYHRFSPNLWAAGLPNSGYRLGSEGKGHLMLSSPVTTQNRGVDSAANIYSWQGKTKLMLNCGFLFIFQSPHCECLTIVLNGKMRKEDQTS